MTDPAAWRTPDIASELSPLLAFEASDAPPDRRFPWYRTIGPAYAAVFVWIAFFDRLGSEAVPRAPFPVLLVAALISAILCDLLLYRPAALWGYRSGQRLSIVASSTFGERGAFWLCGPLLGMAAVVWYALALGYSLDLILSGLIHFHLLDPTVLTPARFGSFTLKAPVVLLTLGWWIFITRLAGKNFTHVIATLMKVYTPTAFVLLAMTALAALILTTRALSVPSDQVSPSISDIDSISVFPTLGLIHLMFGFFAMAGLMAVDWGRASQDERDVRLGGAIGVALSAFLTTALALLVVLCGDALFTLGKPAASGRALEVPPGVSAPTFVSAVNLIFNEQVAATILALFGVASLAPACSSVSLFTDRFFRCWPSVKRKRWSWIGAAVAFLMVATSVVERADDVFTVMGALFAPAAGCLAADYQIQGGTWRGIRKGYHLPGMVAWILGMVVGFCPLIQRTMGIGSLIRVQPASLIAFGVAYLAYRLMAAIGPESRWIAISTDGGAQG